MTMVLPVSSNMACRSQPPSTILDEHYQLQRKRFISIDERQSVRSSNTSMGSRTVEDSTREWVDQDDEYSCNSGSEQSDPQLLDDNSEGGTTGSRSQSALIEFSKRSHHGDITTMMIEEDDDDDDSDTQANTNIHRPCYESANRDIPQPLQSHPSKMMDFCWLPNNTNTLSSSLASSNGNVPYHNYIYIGIPYNPPIVCSEGTTRGNVRSLHRKAWLEVSDRQHRYGKHLRMYYRHWESLYILSPNDSNSNHHIDTFSIGAVRGTFFDWLDSQGVHEGQPLPEIPDCPRSVLDTDTVTYIDDCEESNEYAVRIVTEKLRAGRLLRSNGTIVRTGPTGWMFVIRDNVMYVAPKVVSNGICAAKRFHHSSFFGGRAVQAAGIIVTDENNGTIQQVLPHSGHYRPGESDVQRVLYFLHEMGVCWSTFTVDVQQFLFIDRTSHHNNSNTSTNCCYTKKKKVESLHLRSAVTVADFLSHKARCLLPNGIFAEIEARRYPGNENDVMIE